MFYNRGKGQTHNKARFFRSLIGFCDEGIFEMWGLFNI